MAYMMMRDTDPHLKSEWSPLNVVEFERVAKGSNKKFLWVCSKKHSWEESPKKRTSGRGCPYCSGKRVLEGFNDLATTHPTVAVQCSEKSIKSPREVSAGSHVKLNWICDLGHEYDCSVANKTRGKGCPYCAGKKVLPGFNDLATTHPEISSMWSPNNTKSPNEVSAGLGLLVELSCPKYPDHTWSSALYYLTKKNKKVGCPYCSGRTLLPGFNDLETTHPELVEEWDDPLDPASVTYGSTARVWWKCKPKGHRWNSVIFSRTRKIFTTCPECISSSRSSKPERELFEYIESILKPEMTLLKNNRSLISRELDIYIPELKIAIEFNGLFWHSENQGKDRLYHKSKYLDCKERGVQLIMVWEDDWSYRKNVVKKMIAHKVNASSQKTVYARNTYFTSITGKEAAKFLKDNHLQGEYLTSKHFGLRDKNSDEILSVMSIKHYDQKKEIEIKRFSSSCKIPGGFSKLLKNVSCAYSKVANKITSYSHNDHSWGDIYEKNGFDKVHDGEPGYFYRVGDQRKHRLNYSPKRFKERKDLVFEEGRSERELASINKLERIWDCGSARWEMSIS